MKKTLIYLGSIILMIFIALQFIPVSSVQNQNSTSIDFLTAVNPPSDITRLIKNGCYDCHSNATEFPWYSKIAPVSWMINTHISEARENVNFSDWSSNDIEDQTGILQDCLDEIENNEMPLASYKIMHSEARFTEKDKVLLTDWIKNYIKENETLSGKADEN